MNRRARIKGIANIPVRRKTEPIKTENDTENSSEKLKEQVTPSEEEIEPINVQCGIRKDQIFEENISNNTVNNSTSEIKLVCRAEPSVKNIPVSLRSPEVDRKLQSPLSPNKIPNRSRIRAAPKLIRRNSVQGSASESEDDGRRSRIRNDSVCSTTSFTTEVKEETTKDKIISLKVQKQFRRSEQSKKITEARKDFYHKFKSSKPDRKKLTMMDLIYYNPISNPMPQRKEVIQVEEPTQIEEEKEDDPEEESNPVPQVKVGPNGEIILDEQSLVIEQTGTKKGREKLANSQVINVDDLNRNYGVYKRPKRSKDWTAIETLRFYRTLNTVGTDFSLMVSLFPGRTRRELKMKFKKEEKTNRQLIDKALTNPLDFDLSELEKQCEEEQKLIEKMEEDRLRSKERRSKKKFKKISDSASQMEEENEDDETEVKQDEKVKRRPKRTLKFTKDRYSALNIDEITTSESDDSEDDFRRKRKLRGSNTKQKRDTIEEVKKERETVEPGSLMILSSADQEGRQVFKVFMVTPTQNKVAVDLSDDVIQSLKNSLGDAETVTLDLPVINNENVE